MSRRRIHYKVDPEYAFIDSNLQPKRVKETDKEISKDEKMEILKENIRKQIEFYLGDPNMSKDKNLQEIIRSEEDDCIKILFLLNFERLKSFFFESNIPDEDDIRKTILVESIKTSKILELKDKEEKVQRIIPFDFAKLNSREFREEVDSRMIYVENLPPFIDQEILANIFCDSGKILHVSIPKDQSKKSKGFAFIEYSNKEEATAALKKNKTVPEKMVPEFMNIPVEPLKVMSKSEWLYWKYQLKGSNQNSGFKRRGGYRGRGSRGRGGRGRGGRDNHYDYDRGLGKDRERYRRRETDDRARDHDRDRDRKRERRRRDHKDEVIEISSEVYLKSNNLKKKDISKEEIEKLIKGRPAVSKVVHDESSKEAMVVIGEEGLKKKFVEELGKKPIILKDEKLELEELSKKDEEKYLESTKRKKLKLPKKL